jgi:predicted Zn-dependent protease
MSVNLKQIIAILILFSICTHKTLFANNQVLVIKDLEVENFIKKLVTPLFKVAGVDEKSISIFLIDNPIPNAFVTGGQNIFIHTGLITLADNYNEIIGVLAHELGHITGGHLSRAEIAYANVNIFVLLGFAAMLLTIPFMKSDNVSDMGGVIGFLGYSTQQIAVGSMLSYSRGEESQADQIAVEYLSQTDYDVGGFLTFMEKLQKKEDSTLTSNSMYAWYSTHPLTKDRISFLSNHIKNNTRDIKANKGLEHEFTMVKAKIEGYVWDYKAVYNVYGKEHSNKALYALAGAEYKEGNYEKSRLYLEKILQNYPSNKYILEFIADTYFYQDNYISALEYYKKVYSQDMNDVISFRLANVYFALKDNKNSLKYLNLTLQINKNNPDAWRIKALIYGSENNIAMADASLAEYYFILQNYSKAKHFAGKSINTLGKNKISLAERIDMQDILNY